ncbi:hypothetical protein [Swingsia samuiensis]|uniref:Terminase n=1 Tax=Swingsia samuiensis TaxID=1293412 RepID=A0A4Y6UGV9_9PROT|nr:hypothetical protein [Swingsia samuiensis]QDH16793.1 hypothetical protein E3D00_03825 [Swingsia samuiensis]
MEKTVKRYLPGRRVNRKKKFLDLLSRSGNVSESGRKSGVQRSTLYHWREVDKAFAEDWDDALEVATDVLEAEARRRAVEGYDEPIIYGGKLVRDPQTGLPVQKKKYSDGLMTFLLKAHRPARFKSDYMSAHKTPILINITQDDSAL